MNKKTSLAIFTIFLLGCNNPSTTLNPEISIRPSSIPSSTFSSTPVETTTKLYNMSNIDLNNNIEFAKGIPISYNFNGKLNDKGNGLVILKSYAIKIVNFKQLEKKLIDNDFGDSSLSIDENGDGLLSWSPAQLITPASTNNAGVGLGIYKYKKVKNFDISDETFNSNPNQDKSDLAKTEKTKNLYKNIRENDSIKIDENGNGLVIKDLTDSSFKISIIKNYNIENKEYNLSTQQKIITQYSNEINSKFDSQGNGFISWTYDYQNDPNELNNVRSEIVIKKLENFIPVGNEISLGSDYYGGKIILDKNGTGFVAWQKELDGSFSRVRKIKNYVPENKAYELSLNQSDSPALSFRYNLNVLTNNYGDGFILWQEFNRQLNNYNYGTTCYIRPIENYNISTQNLKEYIPAAKPIPRPTPVPVTPGVYIVDREGNQLEIISINGTVYDNEKKVVDDAEIKIVALFDPSLQIPIAKTVNGKFMIENLPVADVEITITKAGYKTLTRKVKLLPNKDNLPTINQFDFGGNKDIDKEYFLEKE